MKKSLLVFSFLLLSLTATLFAYDLSRSDRSFFEKAAKSGMAEVAISEGVQDRLTRSDVKDFARMMVADHGTANAQLEALAATKGVTLPPKDKEYTDLSAKWNKKAKDADKDYVNQMVDDHQDAVSLFKDASKSKDADIANFAVKTLPTLEHHLEVVKALKKTVK